MSDSDLAPGQRLIGGPRSAFAVIGPGPETPRHGFIRARKVFWNYRDADRSLYEAAEDEWLSVLIRVPRRPDPKEVRRDLEFELRRVLGSPGAAWFPEPLDVVEWAAPGASDPIPLLVLSDPQGTPLSGLPASTPPGPLLELIRETLDLLAALEAAGLAVPAFDASEWSLDRDGRWTYLDTSSIVVSPAPGASLEPWGPFARQILARLGPDEPGAEDVRRLLDRLRDERPATAADLLAGRGRASRIGPLRRALGWFRRSES